jgi:hypothetical protein
MFILNLEPPIIPPRGDKKPSISMLLVFIIKAVTKDVV